MVFIAIRLINTLYSFKTTNKFFKTKYMVFNVIKKDTYFERKKENE